ncbi:type I-E CRISPR-associated protein Cas5/CasD [Pseudochelatococcus sp. B33]
MMRWLVLRLNAPLASFGGTAIDSRGATRDFPAASAITGLLANALGYERYQTDLLDRLQERLVFGARREAEPPLGRMTDFQTVKLGANDRGWTTRGRIEERAGGAATYDSPHIRYRDYHADTRMTVVLNLSPADEAPTLDHIAAALDRPARPLFLGRKGCLPADYLLAPQEANRWVEAVDARAALIAVPGNGEMRALWPAAAGKSQEIADRRNWRSGLHGGTRRVAEGRITPAGQS